jgi:tetrapyrrole methylase family protein/MazG family protein
VYPHFEREPQSETDWFQALANLVRYLRSEDGCPWDREQSSADFAAFLGEETEELKQAIESGDDAHIAEELGDALFTALATAAAAEEEGRLSLEDVLRTVHEKMIRRHEHVFGEAMAKTPEEVMAVWKRVKDKEKKRGGT